MPALTQSKLISSHILPQDPNYDRWVDDLNDLILRAQEPSDVDVSIIIPIHDIAPDYINDAIKSIENQVVDGKPIVIHDSMAGLSGNAISVDSMNRTPDANQAGSPSCDLQTDKSSRTIVQVVIVDDHSTDPATMEWIEDLADDPELGGITIIRQPEDSLPGVASSRNAGLLASIGRYVMFLDSDDTLTDEHSLESLLNAIKFKPTAKVALGDFHYEFQDGVRCDCRSMLDLVDFAMVDFCQSPNGKPIMGQDDDSPGNETVVQSTSDQLLDDQLWLSFVGLSFVDKVLTDNLLGDPLPSERGVVWGRLYDRWFLLNETPLHGWFDPTLRRLSDVVWNVMVMTSLDSDAIVYVPEDIVSYKVRSGSITNGVANRKRDEMEAVIDSLRNKIIPVLRTKVFTSLDFCNRTGVSPLIYVPKVFISLDFCGFNDTDYIDSYSAAVEDSLNQWVDVFENHLMMLCDGKWGVDSKGWFFDRNLDKFPLVDNGLNVNVTGLKRI